ncbi:helix-turn-helix domain-containing protein [Companilactobacillus sp. HBUAS56275]|uniref:helix-turn-helix domain-containing protein n=1 Tax=Companilactobacillus sp. HBUAS56275 TaxID=3109364 RepID=UPI002FEFCFE1
MNRIKELRLNKHLTLDDISKEVGIKRGTFNNYENGNTEPTLENWFKLARYFCVSLDYLTGFSDERR